MNTKHRYMLTMLLLLTIAPLTSCPSGETVLVGHSAGHPLSLGEGDRGVRPPLATLHITSPYGYRTDPLTGRRRFHNGIDLRARYVPVYSILSGTVIRTGHDPTSGLYITIYQGDFTISYCHLSHIRVRTGQPVSAGQPIAISGNSGRSTAPHLHITIRYQGQTIDPAVLLGWYSE